MAGKDNSNQNTLINFSTFNSLQGQIVHTLEDWGKKNDTANIREALDQIDHEKVVKHTIVEFLIRFNKPNDNGKRVVGNFTVTDTIIKLVPDNKTYLVKDLIEKIKASGRFKVFDDKGLIHLFGDMSFVNDKPLSRRIYIHENQMSGAVIIADGKELNIYTEEALGQILLLTDSLAEAAKSILKIPFTNLLMLSEEKVDEDQVVFLIGCDKDGNLSLEYGAINPEDKRNAGGAVLFNEGNALFDRP